MLIKEYERFDLIQKNGFGIIQNKKWFSYGIDAVLLSEFSDIKKNTTVVDFGSGNGIIPLLLSLKSDPAKIIAVEKQIDVYNMAMRSIKHNGLEKLIEVINYDIANITDKINKSSVDVVISNPPYFKGGNALVNDDNVKAISRHETTATLEDFIKSASEILKNKGEFYMVHRPMRLADIIYYCRLYKLEPKLIRFVSPNNGKPPNIFLIKCIKGGNSELKYLSNLNVYNDEGCYTEDIIDIYRKLNIDVFLEEYCNE